MARKVMITLKALEDAVSWLQVSEEPGEKRDFIPSPEQAREEVMLALRATLLEPGLSPEVKKDLQASVLKCIEAYDTGDTAEGARVLFVVMDHIWKVRVSYRKPGQVWT